jgi:alpha-glucosidase (family GH31 glycosyl hydrolase)
MVHVNGLAKEVHGIYGHEWIATLYENYEKDFPNDRLFKLGRAGYAGSQRYGLLPWSGDVARNWSGFQAQNEVMLGMSMSGLPYMHSDAGGFAMFPRDSILYIRWLQYLFLHRYSDLMVIQMLRPSQSFTTKRYRILLKSQSNSDMLCFPIIIP